MDERLGVGAVDRRLARPVNPSCAYPGNEWRVVPASHEQEAAKARGEIKDGRKGGGRADINNAGGGLRCAAPENPIKKNQKRKTKEATPLFIDSTGTLLQRHSVLFYSAIDKYSV